MGRAGEEEEVGTGGKLGEGRRGAGEQGRRSGGAEKAWRKNEERKEEEHEMRGSEVKKKPVEVTRRHWNNEQNLVEKPLRGEFGAEAKETWRKAAWRWRGEREIAVREKGGEGESKREAGTVGKVQ